MSAATRIRRTRMGVLLMVVSVLLLALAGFQPAVAQAGVEKPGECANFAFGWKENVGGQSEGTAGVVDFTFSNFKDNNPNEPLTVTWTVAAGYTVTVFVKNGTTTTTGSGGTFTVTGTPPLNAISNAVACWNAPVTTQPPTTAVVTTAVVTTAVVTTQPATTAVVTTQPATTQPATTQPATTQPATTQPATTQPATTQPATTQPATTQPVTTEPVTTEPVTTEATTTTIPDEVLPTIITKPDVDENPSGPEVLPRVIEPAPDDAGVLPFTGPSNPTALVISAGLMMALGGGMLLSTRRRPAQQR